MVEYEGKMEGGLYNPNYIVVSKKESNKKFSGLGTQSFIESRGIDKEDQVILENKFTLKEIKEAFTKGGSIMQGTYFYLILESSVDEKYTIEITIPAETLIHDLFSGSLLKDGCKFVESQIYSIVNNNATPTLLLHNSQEFQSYKNEWDEFSKNKEANKVSVDKKIQNEVDKYNLGEIYVVAERSTIRSGELSLTKYLYLGKDLLPKAYIKKKNYMEKGAKKHLFVALETIYFLLDNKNNEVLLKNLKAGKLTEKELNHEVDKSSEEECNSYVIKQPYYNAFVDGFNENLESLLIKKSVLNPCLLEDSVILAYTNNEILESADEDLIRYKKKPKMYSLKSCCSFDSKKLSEFKETLDKFVNLLFTTNELAKYRLQQKSKYFRHRIEISAFLDEHKVRRKNPYSFPTDYYTKLYSYFLKNNLEISFLNVVHHQNYYPISIDVAKNVDVRNYNTPEKIIEFHNLEYYDETSILLSKTEGQRNGS